MVTVSGYTAERMKSIEDASVVSGLVVGDDLVLTRYDETEITAGHVRGSQGIQGVPGEVTTADLNAGMAIAAPPGMVTMCVFPVIPIGWLGLEGQAVGSADTLYPDLWGVSPSEWKSGSSLILPDMRGRVPTGQDTGQVEFNALEEVGGTKTKVLAKNNVPKHYHTMDHDHPSTSLVIDYEKHKHKIRNILNAGSDLYEVSTDGASGSGIYGVAASGYTNGKYLYADWEPGPSQNIDGHHHTGTVDIPAMYKDTEDGSETGLGSSPFGILSPYFVLRFIIKT